MITPIPTLVPQAPQYPVPFHYLPIEMVLAKQNAK
jgi:hypothetical protein